MGKKVYALFGGFSSQFWTRLGTPDIKGNCDGLSLCEFDTETGELSLISQNHGIDSPSTLVVSPDEKYIYVTNEGHDYKGPGLGGGLTAFSLDKKKKKISFINETFSLGASACYVSLDKTGKYLFVANGGSKFYITRVEIVDGKPVPVCVRDEGCVCVFAIREDGGIGELKDRIVLEGTGIDPVEHASAHPHSVLIDEDDFIIIPNKGGDNIYVGKFDRDSEKINILSIFKEEYGSSPRHAAFVKGTPYVLVQNEYDGHINSYELDKTNGELRRISRLDTIIAELPPKKNALLGDRHPWGIDVQLHPNGRFVFTNNTQTSINTFIINEHGELKLSSQFHLDMFGLTRGMQIDPTGHYLLVTGVMSEKVFVFEIDQQDGHIELKREVAMPTPTALRFVSIEDDTDSNGRDTDLDGIDTDSPTVYEDKKKYLVCIDSDGCAIDSMTVKHTSCFGPALLEVWNLEEKREEILRRWNEINLYSKTRGINRFKGLAAIIEEYKLEDADNIKAYLEWTKISPELSNTALAELCKNSPYGVFKRAIKWSYIVNEKIEKLPISKPFENVKRCIELMHEKANITVVSSANHEAIIEEWKSSGLLEYADNVFSQSDGSKIECIKKMKQRGYSDEQVMMVGDAPGDYEAAAENSAWFYPILADHEVESWEQLLDYFEKFVKGDFTQEIQSMLNMKMQRNLEK